MLYSNKSLWLCDFVILYSLFAFNRIKALFMPSRNGMTMNNLIVILLIVGFIITVLNRKVWFHFFLLISFSVFVLLFFVSFVKTNDALQTLYALLVMICPLLFSICLPAISKSDFLVFVRHVAFYSTVYALLAIIAVYNYSSLLSFLGNASETQGKQVRASLPLGSSITVSYYLNASLPLLLFLFSTEKRKTWRIIYFSGIVLNVIATLLELSRSSVITMCIILLVFFYFFRKEMRGRLVLVIVVLVASVLFLSMFANLTRILNIAKGFSNDGRFGAWRIAMGLFKEQPLAGTGIATYYQRLWTGTNVISINGETSLIDPHSAFFLVLSELGLLGIFGFLLMFSYMYRRIMSLRDNSIRNTGLLILVGVSINSIVGSQLVNEINYSLIVYIYFFSFICLSLKPSLQIRK